MVLDAVPAWPAVGSIAGGAGAIGLAWAIRQHRGRPGVDWFLGVFAAQAVWCLSYGIGLLVADPTLRTVLEATTWLGIIWTGIAFLGFALEYTGRGDVVRSRPFAGIIGFGLLSTLILATNGSHGAFWSGLRVDPVFGVSTVSYAFGPWAYLVVAVETVLVASAVFLLVDTLLSYGPLYRRESAAVALSSLPPGFALVAWTLELGPVPQLQLAPIMFVPHVLLDAYAFNRIEMFDRNPTTSRAAERTAIDDLADPIVALAPDGRVVRLNPAAESLLGVGASTARDRPLDAFLDVTVAVEGDAADETDELTVGTGGRRRTYAVATSPLTDPNGTHVGYTVVFSDVTERERRRQQLEVLNRILRHNLRNDAGVVAGYALGEKAGTVESLLSDAAREPIAVDEAIESVVGDARERNPDATIELVIGDGEGATTTDGAGESPDAAAESGGDPVGASPAIGWTAALRLDALHAVVENIVENALEHHDGEGVERVDGGPWVRVTLRRESVDGAADDAGEHGTGDRLVLTIADDGPGIPDHEVNAVESGRETALEHGSGIGMWVVEWGAGAMDADVDYEDRAPRGTLVTVRIPLVEKR